MKGRFITQDELSAHLLLWAGHADLSDGSRCKVGVMGNGDPVVRCEASGRCWTLPGKSIVQFAVEDGITQGDQA